jgi:hypothetical protein
MAITSPILAAFPPTNAQQIAEQIKSIRFADCELFSEEV